jgi:hypothetical protein
MVCLLLSITDYEYTFQKMTRAFKPIPLDATDAFANAESYQFAKERLLYSESGFERFVILLISFFGVFTLYLRHDAKVGWNNKDLP